MKANSKSGVATQFSENIENSKNSDAQQPKIKPTDMLITGIRGCRKSGIVASAREQAVKLSPFAEERVQDVADFLDGETPFEFDMFCEKVEFGKFTSMTPAEKENARRLAMFGLVCLLEATCRAANANRTTT